jgi:predicted site-specific integrase-resolvase
MLDSIGSDAAIAGFLGLSEATVRRYRRQGQAPKPVMYALFWETPWGLDLADSCAVNDARMAYARAMSLERQNAALKRRVVLLEAELERVQVSANAPFFREA